MRPYHYHNGRNIGVLFSGGLDSAALIGFLNGQRKTIHPIYIRCGLKWEKREIEWAQRFLRSIPSHRIKPLTVLSLPLEDAYRNNWSTNGKIPSHRTGDRAVYLPARNLLLATKALLFLSSRKIWSLSLATLKSNPFPDGQPSYFDHLKKVLSLSFNRPIMIDTPFRHLSKDLIIKKSRGVPLHLSLSCLNPTPFKHCGRCNKCAERRRAFKKAGIKDKTAYARG